MSAVILILDRLALALFVLFALAEMLVLTIWQRRGRARQQRM